MIRERKSGNKESGILYYCFQLLAGDDCISLPVAMCLLGPLGEYCTFPPYCKAWPCDLPWSVDCELQRLNHL